MTKPPVSWDMNFASRDYRLSSRLAAGLSAVSAALIAAAVAMVLIVISYRGQKAELDRQMHELAGRAEKLQPALEERDRLLRELKTMSALFDAKRFSWTGLLTSIERMFPVGAALDRVQYNPKDGSLVLEGRAQSPEALRNLMVGLEKSPAFHEAFLKHQSVEKGAISFTVGAHYREQAFSETAR